MKNENASPFYPEIDINIIDYISKANPKLDNIVRSSIKIIDVLLFKETVFLLTSPINKLLFYVVSYNLKEQKCIYQEEQMIDDENEEANLLFAHLFYKTEENKAIISVITSKNNFWIIDEEPELKKKPLNKLILAQHRNLLDSSIIHIYKGDYVAILNSEYFNNKEENLLIIYLFQDLNTRFCFYDSEKMVLYGSSEKILFFKTNEITIQDLTSTKEWFFSLFNYNNQESYKSDIYCCNIEHINSIFDVNKRLIKSMTITSNKKFALLTDPQDRIMLVDVDFVVIIKYWKGYRETLVSFIEFHEFQDFQEFKVEGENNNHNTNFLFYSGARNLLERWDFYDQKLDKVIIEALEAMYSSDTYICFVVAGIYARFIKTSKIISQKLQTASNYNLLIEQMKKEYKEYKETQGTNLHELID